LVNVFEYALNVVTLNSSHVPNKCWVPIQADIYNISLQQICPAFYTIIFLFRSTTQIRLAPQIVLTTNSGEKKLQPFYEDWGEWWPFGMVNPNPTTTCLKSSTCWSSTTFQWKKKDSIHTKQYIISQNISPAKSHMSLTHFWLTRASCKSFISHISFFCLLHIICMAAMENYFH